MPRTVPTQLAEHITAAVLALMGGADMGTPATEIEAFEAALSAADVEHGIVASFRAPHGFSDIALARFADASADTRRRALEFIDAHGT
jgi:carboxymethylenebutenolidase